MQSKDCVWPDMYVCVSDVDECESQGAKLCGAEGEMCVNIPGAYKCDCQDGYTRRKNKCHKKGEGSLLLYVALHFERKRKKDC